jgi:hypothetical protein
MSVVKVFEAGGANGVDVFVLSSGQAHMHAIVRGGSVSLVSCIEPSEQLFAAAESLGRVKHVFLLGKQIERWSSVWVKRFSALLWAPTAVSGVDMLLSKDTLLPFLGKVFLFSVTEEAALFVSQHRLVLSGGSMPLSRHQDPAFELWLQQVNAPEKLPREYESLLSGLRPDFFLIQQHVLTRVQVIENIVEANKSGMLAAHKPQRRRERIAWFVLFLLNVLLFLLYIVSRGS